jgi:2,3-bisphosphoglycerate-independent phosphoglycerate mutase
MSLCSLGRTSPNALRGSNSMPSSIERVAVVFLDGVGLGDDDPTANPLAEADMPVLHALLDDRRLVRDNAGARSRNASLQGLDACLGVPGLPQSGTGQTTLLTGINAPRLIGKHDGPYPNRRLCELLNNSVFSALRQAGRSVAYANAYPDRFLNRITRGTQRLSANTRAALLAGLALRGPAELKSGCAVSSLFTNQYFRQQGYDVPDISPEAAGQHLAHLASAHTFTYFEFWLTDVAGHRQNHALARLILTQLDHFIAGTLDNMDLARSLLMVISDHGNFEDLRTPKHTLNPALTVLVGAHHAEMAARLASLTDVAPALLAALDVPQSAPADSPERGESVAPDRA